MSNSGFTGESSRLRLASNNGETVDQLPDVSHDHRYGNGGGGGNMLEVRVAKLEANIEHMATLVSDIRQDLRSCSHDVAEIKTELVITKLSIESMKSTLSEVSSSVSGIEKTTSKIKWISLGVSIALAIACYLAAPYFIKMYEVLNSMIIK